MMEVNRRDFLRIVGIGGASAAVAGCARRPPESLVPYVVTPEQAIPGKPTWYATVCRECPAGCGMLVKTVDGRAIKVEGNPDHPVSRGGLCARGQASLQGLYNPDRIRGPQKKGADGRWRPVKWEEAEKLVAGRLAELDGQGDRIACVSPVVTGSLETLLRSWLARFGASRWLRYEPVSYESLREANRLAFGSATIPFYDLAAAEMILSFGADFLDTWFSPVEHARQFAVMRTYRQGKMGRFAYVGPRLSLTGASADEWVAVRPGSEPFLALAMVQVILAEGLATFIPAEEARALQKLVAAFTPAAAAERTGVSTDRVQVLARAFARRRPSLALADGRTSNGTDTCLAVNILNYVVGNVNRTIHFGPAAAVGRASAYRDIRALIDAMEAGRISLLLLLGGVNPVFTLPEGERFRRALGKVSLVVSFSSFLDETADAAHLILPDHTFLESWGDYEPWSGVRGLQQPAMRPLFDTRATPEVLFAVAERAGRPIAPQGQGLYEYLKERWGEVYRSVNPAADFDTFWTEARRRGGVFTLAGYRPVELDAAVFRHRFNEPKLVAIGASTNPALVPYPSPYFYDGRMANRPWLQELPDALTAVVWDSWLDVNPADARRLGVRDGDVVRVESPFGHIEVTAHLSPNVSPGTVAVAVGQGHSAYGRYAERVGANPFGLLPARPEGASGALPWIATRVRVVRTGERRPLVSTSGSDRDHHRGVAQVITLEELQAGAEEGEERELLKMYPPHIHPEHRWAMVIDLNLCTGCGACVTACYAENNVAVVGKQHVEEGREMSWIRIERVNLAPDGRPEHVFVPMLCQQCDYAPCEPVCPVFATYHNRQGLNVQVYNRCVGTRYCSNNCPYKVRRFNWFTYEWPEPLELQLNPNVTVRSMGVMEKCTFCVQRIREGLLTAKAQDRPVRDGEIVPACMQTCPTRAIVFGDLKDPESQVAKKVRDRRRYVVLEEVNAQPAVTYLKRIRAGAVEG